MADNINTKSARANLAPQREPYWERVRTGVHVGFRKLEKGDGTWIARFIRPSSVPGKKYEKLYQSFGVLPDGDLRYGAFDAAVELTKKWVDGIEHGVSHKPVTVKEACENYVKNQRTQKSKASSSDAEGRFKRLVYGKPIGSIQLSKLRAEDVRKWRDAQVTDEDDAEDDDVVRRSKDTANRNLNAIKAALNLALKDRAVSSDIGWKSITAFKGVGRRRDVALDFAQRKALIENCPNDLSLLVKAMLLTGARPGELAKLTVADFNKKDGSIRINSTSHGKTGFREASLSTAARQFFTEQAKGKLPAAVLLPRSDGTQWNKDSWKDLFKEAVKAAKLPEKTVMYSLRHTAISEMVMSGMDSLMVARLAGTSVTMIDKHYGHLRHDVTRARLDAVQML
jgi:integrase